MIDPINFDIDVLAALYQLHPERRDVFVEGEDDQGLIRTFLERNGHRNASVFPISVVNVPAHLVLQRSLPHPSNRSEVIILAMELETKGVLPGQATCIADADMAYILGQHPVCALLLLTDYTSMELYAFTAETVDAILLLASPKTTVRGDGLVADAAAPLQFLFALQATNFALQFGLAWIDSIENFFSVQAGHIKFDEEQFRNRYLVMRLPAAKLQEFNNRLRTIQSMPRSDIRSQIRGYDFVRLLTWFLKKIEKCKHLNEYSIRHLLYAAIHPQDLAKEPLFSSLLERMAS